MATVAESGGDNGRLLSTGILPSREIPTVPTYSDKKPGGYDESREKCGTAILNVFLDRIRYSGIPLIVTSNRKPPESLGTTYEAVRGDGDKIKYRYTLLGKKIPEADFDIFFDNNLLGLDVGLEAGDAPDIDQMLRAYHTARVAEIESKKGNLMVSTITTMEDLNVGKFGSEGDRGFEVYERDDLLTLRPERKPGNKIVYLYEGKHCLLIVPDAISSGERADNDGYNAKWKQGDAKLVDIETGKILINNISGEWDRSVFGAHDMVGKGSHVVHTYHTRNYRIPDGVSIDPLPFSVNRKDVYVGVAMEMLRSTVPDREGSGYKFNTSKAEQIKVLLSSEKLLLGGVRGDVAQTLSEREEVRQVSVKELYKALEPLGEVDELISKTTRLIMQKGAGDVNIELLDFENKMNGLLAKIISGDRQLESDANKCNDFSDIRKVITNGIQLKLRLNGLADVKNSQRDASGSFCLPIGEHESYAIVLPYLDKGVIRYTKRLGSNKFSTAVDISYVSANSSGDEKDKAVYIILHQVAKIIIRKAIGVVNSYDRNRLNQRNFSDASEVLDSMAKAVNVTRYKLD